MIGAFATDDADARCLATLAMVGDGDLERRVGSLEPELAKKA